MSTSDTIVAIATPPGKGGVGMVRVSGAAVGDIAKHVVGKLPKPRQAVFSIFKDTDDTTIDHGLVLYFPAPHSFTGEDVLELQGHGGPVILDMLVKRIIQLGARLAKPGEFSERAFLNDKIDLTQAEAIADLIDASSTQAAKSAVRSLQGEFSKKINDLVESLIHLRMYVEAAIDFPEEEVDFLSDDKITNELTDIIKALMHCLTTAKQGELLREGMHIVITGKPNAGKSSLLNVLSGVDRAIVTDTPGTTRDIIRVTIELDGLPCHIVDTAGLRQSEDSVEQEGVKRAVNEINKADHIVLVVDASETKDKNIKTLWPDFLPQPDHKKLSLVFNKIDLTNQPANITKASNTTIHVSAKTGAGIDMLREHLKSCVGYQPATEGIFIARRRHIDALQQALEQCQQGQQQLQKAKAGELLAEHLHQAQINLNQITGEFTSDDLLGRIFSSFCIGK